MLNERLLSPAVLLAAALAALFVYASPLAPLWYDELYTLTVFVPLGPIGLLSDYRVPNNHLFFTLLLWAWHGVVGDDLLRLRLLGLLLTAPALAAVFVAARGIAGARAGALAALVLGTSQIVGNFAAQLRGYGLSITLVAICLAAGVSWWRRDLEGRGALAVYGLSGALAVWTLPSNLVFVAAVAFWVVLAARPWHEPRRLARCAWLALPLLGLLGYVPVAEQVVTWSGLSVWAGYDGFLTVIARDLLLADLAWLVPVALLLALLARRWPTPRPAWLLLAVAALTLLAPLAGPVPWPRNYVPLLALLAVAGGLLLDRLATRVPGGIASVLAGLLVMLLLRPLIAPPADVDNAVVATHPGELMSPYYLREDFRPDIALGPLLEERDAPPSLVLARATTFLEMEPQFRLLSTRHLACGATRVVGADGLQVFCLPAPRADFRARRVVVVARSEQDAQGLVGSLKSVGMDATGLLLRALPSTNTYHRLWTVVAP